MPIKKIAIIGLGLIGGSLALAIKKANTTKTIIGVDLNKESIEYGLKIGAIDKGTTSLAEGVEKADLVFLATPLGQMLDVAKTIQPFLQKGCIVTDAGSCKKGIVNSLQEIFKEQYFIGGHPMTGSERDGIRAANPYLFENAVYVLTLTEKTDSYSLKSLKEVIESIGANILELDVERHDLLVAAVSHLPHLIAVNLVNAVAEIAKLDDLTFMLAAGGFKDTTRIASGNEFIWHDIFLSNRKMLLEVLALFKNRLNQLETFIIEEKSQAILKDLQQAKEIREDIPDKAKGLLPSIFEIIISVPDKPGIIADISGLLAKHQINIIDIAVLRVRLEEKGSMRLGFNSEADVKLAVDVLQKNNFKVMRR